MASTGEACREAAVWALSRVENTVAAWPTQLRVVFVADLALVHAKCTLALDLDFRAVLLQVYTIPLNTILTGFGLWIPARQLVTVSEPLGFPTPTGRAGPLFSRSPPELDFDLSCSTERVLGPKMRRDNDEVGRNPERPAFCLTPCFSYPARIGFRLARRDVHSLPSHK